jgi:hypothetical protein
MPGFKHAKKGDRLVIPADDYNAAMEAARAFAAQRLGGGPRHATPDATLCLVRNNSGSDVGQFAVLGIDGVLIEPTLNEPEFRSRRAFSGVEPAAEHVGGRSVITLNPIRSGEIGKAVLAGATAVRIKTPGDPDDVTAADVDEGDTTHLIANPAGAWRVFWIQSVDDAGATGDGEEAEPNDRWAIVASAAPSASQRFKVEEVFDDYVTAKTWDGSTLGDTLVKIALPWELRKTGWDGQTVHGVGYSGYGSQERRAAYPDYAQQEVINLQYFEGAEITATVPRGGTGVADGDEDVLWEDDNRGARRWVPKLYEIHGCDNDSYYASGDLQPSVGKVVRLEGGEECYRVSEADPNFRSESGGVLVSVDKTFEDCEACKQTVCISATVCGESGTETFSVAGGSTLEVGDVFAHNGKCYTIASIITCAGTETSADAPVQESCEACQTACFELEKCGDTSQTLTVQGPHVVGDVVKIEDVCYTVARQVDCPDGVEESSGTAFPDCESCSAGCFELVNCLDEAETIAVQGIGWDEHVDSYIQYTGKCWKVTQLETCPDSVVVLDYNSDFAAVATCEECQAAVSCTDDCAGKSFISADGTSDVDAAGAEANALENLMAALAELCPSGASDLCGDPVYLNAEENAGIYTVKATMCYACCCPPGQTLIEVVIPPITCVDGEITYETEWVCKPECSNSPTL